MCTSVSNICKSVSKHHNMMYISKCNSRTRGSELGVSMHYVASVADAPQAVHIGLMYVSWCTYRLDVRILIAMIFDAMRIWSDRIAIKYACTHSRLHHINSYRHITYAESDRIRIARSNRSQTNLTPNPEECCKLHSIRTCYERCCARAGCHYFSNPTHLMRPRSFDACFVAFVLCVCCRVKDRHKLLHYLPLLKNMR